MSKTTYYARRLVVSVLLVFVVATFLFFIFRMMPGDYATMMAQQGAGPEEMEALREQWGLNEPLHVQYFRYLANLLTGEAGTSRATNQPVVSYILPYLANSLILIIPAIIISFLLGSLYGGLLGIKSGTKLERYGIFPPTIVGTTPDFFIGMVVIFVFATQLGLLPTGGIASAETYQLTDSNWEIYATADFWLHYIAPFLAIVLKYLYYPALVMRGSVVEVSGQEFQRYKKLAGLDPFMRFRSLLKHASLPVITLLPPVTATAISGLVLIEIVFNWPGIGKLVFDSVLERDTPVIQFVFLLIAIWIIFGNLVVDVLYTVIDPRISYGSEE